jgi:hydrogenase expression/formation protein HypD
MKYVDEFRNIDMIENLSKKIFDITTMPHSLMEICGGQTHSILKYNLESFLPDCIKLIHGPGCPVCVTSLEKIDKAVSLAINPEVILTSFGDMMRVPGSKHDLLSCKASGGDVRMVYSPLDSIKLAQNNPDKKVVFFAVGFETTAPSIASTILEAERLNLSNFFILCSHVLVPPAIEFLLSSKNVTVEAFLAAGHVCAIMGFEEYIAISEKYKVPIVVTGFEPVDILNGIYHAILQLENGISEVENQYKRAVSKDGNIRAQKLMSEVFEKTDRNWRGISLIQNSGLKLKEKYSRFDSELAFEFSDIETIESKVCIAGEILQGIAKPLQCNAFGNDCKPNHPLGAPMVSPEGACSAYFSYRKLHK